MFDTVRQNCREVSSSVSPSPAPLALNPRNHPLADEPTGEPRYENGRGEIMQLLMQLNQEEANDCGKYP